MVKIFLLQLKADREEFLNFFISREKIRFSFRKPETFLVRFLRGFISLLLENLSDSHHCFFGLESENN